MTTPGQPAPEGAITDGDLSPLAGLDEASWRAGLDADKLGGYRDASHTFLETQDDVLGRIADAESAMADMSERIDLLESTPAYGQKFLASSWQIASGGRKVLPFNSWLGPTKDLSSWSGSGIRISDGVGNGVDGRGLWRADLHLNFDAPPSGWFGSNTVVKIQVWLTVLAGPSGGTVFTDRRFDLLVTSFGAESAAFSTTFVIPETDAYTVVASVQHDRSSSIRLRGGTVDSCLSVNKWSIGTANAANISNPPDGGTL